MKTINFYLKGGECRGPKAFAKIYDELPKLDTELIKNENYKDSQELVERIEDVEIDCEQGNDEVYNYQYYKITYFDNTNYFDYLDDKIEFSDKDCEYSEYIAIPYLDEEDEENE